MTFKVGDKVICVESILDLVKGKVYTVDYIEYTGSIALREAHSGRILFIQERFIPYSPLMMELL